jgi:NAD(P)-dependent dehydrogenase (short-subunit alcohol dehydrogenase family)
MGSVTFDFSGKVALVTGAGAGVGLATALSFARAGASVVCVGRTRAKLEATAAQITALGGKSIVSVGDVGEEKTAADAVALALSTYGRLDCAFNGAGEETPMQSIVDTDSAQFWEILRVKTGGCFYGMKHQIPALRAQRGAIVNMAGTFALEGFANFGSYVAAAHGVLGLTRTAALEEGRNGLRINAVCPGAINTALLERMVGGSQEAIAGFAQATALGKVATAQDVADAVLFLCSTGAGHVTGTTLQVDGG